jgi:hypothetical protein
MTPYSSDASRARPPAFPSGQPSVSYHSPSQGRLEFGRHGPLRQNGKDVPLFGQARCDNPYAQANLSAGEIMFRYNGHSLNLDWQTAQRHAITFV